MLEDKDKNQAEEKAPAVVGSLKVSNDLLDFSSLSKKSKKSGEKKCDCNDSKCDCKKSCNCKDEKLTPREKAILERKKNQK